MSSFKSQNHDALFLTKQKLLDDDDFSSKKKRVSRDEDPCSIKKKKRKKDKKSKKKKSKRSHRNHSPSKSSSGSDESDEWVEMVDEGGKTKNEEKSGVRSGDIDREDWMSMTGAFATFSRKDLKPDQDNMKKKKGQIDEYNPAQCSRELNPYWRDGGTGLPSTRPDKPSPPREYTSNRREPNKQFRRPHHSDHYGNKYDERRRNRDDTSYYHETSGNWKKPREPIRNRSISPARNDDTRERPPTSEIEASTSQLASNIKTTAESEGVHHYLSDEQMNALGAKIVKAEILGNTKLISELTSKLEAARAYKKLHPAGPPGQEEGAAVMLTMTDERGNTRPLSCPQSTGDPRSKGGKKKAVTHSDGGDRMKFFADDDKYSLKELFEKEKFGSAQDDEREFSEIVAKHTNPNDELEDIFTEKIMKNMSDAKRDQLNLNKAISQHKRSEKSMEACEYCLDSDKMIKHMMASLGSRAYVALPTRKSLTEGHCYISTVGHVACSTMVDEDVWAEILSYRRALTRMFNAQDEDVVFFETAVYFHKHPHLVIHCVPLPRDVGDTAPIYFKKALLECEAEWSNNKKVVDLRGKDIRRGVPKGLPYFWIDFGMDPGFAHVIEDQQLFPNNFAQEIIGGMLDLDHSLWRKPHRENFEAQRKKVVQFATEWKKYDPAVGQ